jgi:hypothetical protein
LWRDGTNTLVAWAGLRLRLFAAIFAVIIGFFRFSGGFSVLIRFLLSM